MNGGQAKHGAPSAHSTSEQGRGLGRPKASRADLPRLTLRALVVAGVLAAVQTATVAHAQSPGLDGPRNFTVVGASLDMPDADIVAKLSSELGTEPEHYAFAFHRVAHFNSVDGCWWKRIDGPQPACVGMSVLAFNLDGRGHQTAQVALYQRFNPPVNADDLTNTIFEAYGDPDLIEAAQHPLLIGSPSYFWSDSFHQASPDALAELSSYTSTDAVEGATGDWLRIFINGERELVHGMFVLLSDQDLMNERVRLTRLELQSRIQRQSRDVLESVLLD